MAYPGDRDEEIDWPPGALKCNRTAVPKSPRGRNPNEPPHSTAAALLAMGTVFGSLLAIGMTTAAMLAPTKPEPPLTAIGADLTSLVAIADGR
jgi:hypothetical protein